MMPHFHISKQQETNRNISLPPTLQSTNFLLSNIGNVIVSRTLEYTTAYGGH